MAESKSKVVGMAEAGPSTSSQCDGGASAVAPRDPTFKMAWQEKYRLAKSYKQEGNEKYKAKAHKAAMGKYHRSLLYIKGIEDAQNAGPLGAMLPNAAGDTLVPVPEEIRQEVAILKMDVYNNLAACILQQPEPSYEKIALYCTNVLEISPDNVKALYRKGVALYHLKDPDSAIELLQRAGHTPQGEKDANIRRYIAMCEKEVAKQNENMKKKYKGMFEKMSKVEVDDG